MHSLYSGVDSYRVRPTIFYQYSRSALSNSLHDVIVIWFHTVLQCFDDIRLKLSELLHSFMRCTVGRSLV